MIAVLHTADRQTLEVRLWEKGAWIAAITKPAFRQQSELLLPTLIATLKKKRKTLKSLKGVLVVVGPGPFSAVRIGVAAANALAYGLQIPVAGCTVEEASGWSGAKLEKKLKQLERQKVSANSFASSVLPLYDGEPNITLPKRV